MIILMYWTRENESTIVMEKSNIQQVGSFDQQSGFKFKSTLPVKMFSCVMPLCSQ